MKGLRILDCSSYDLVRSSPLTPQLPGVTLQYLVCSSPCDTGSGPPVRNTERGQETRSWTDSEERPNASTPLHPYP